MRGWFIHNNFLTAGKYAELNSLLLEAFSSRGIFMQSFSNADIFAGEPIEREKPDFVLFWDKDVLLAEYLESCGIRVINSSRAIRLCDDKSLTYAALSNSGIRQPLTFAAPFTFTNIGYTDFSFVARAAEMLGLPMVVKQARGSFGREVFLVNTVEEAVEVCKNCFPERVIFQKYVASSFGKDLRIQIVGGKVIAAVKRTGKAGDFRSNVSGGGSMEKADAPAEFCDMALKTAQILDVEFGGADIMFGENGEPIFCEMNSNAHFKNLLDACGVNAAEHLADYVSRSVKK